MSDIECRVEALEKANRRWRYAALSLASVVLIALVGGAAVPEEAPAVLQARRIEVLSPDGKPAIVLEAGNDGAMLRIAAPGKDHERAILLSANKESVNLALMKHAEAPLLNARVDDDGAVLALFDGREPSQDPRGILLRTQRPTEGGPALTAIALTKGPKTKEFRAGMFAMEPTETTDISYLLIGGSEGKQATVRVNQQNGKLEVRDQGNKALWTTP
jgi:hypothetical protein